MMISFNNKNELYLALKDAAEKHHEMEENIFTVIHNNPSLIEAWKKVHDWAVWYADYIYEIKSK